MADVTALRDALFADLLRGGINGLREAHETREAAVLRRLDAFIAAVRADATRATEGFCGCGQRWTSAVHDPKFDPEVAGFHVPYRAAEAEVAGLTRENLADVLASLGFHYRAAEARQSADRILAALRRPARRAGGPAMTTPTARDPMERNAAVAALFRLLPDSMFPESFDDLMERVVAIETLARADATRAAEAEVAGLRAALLAIVQELDTGWEHGEECGVWATDDETDEPLYPGDLPGRHEACDCGIDALLHKADAALAAQPAAPEAHTSHAGQCMTPGCTTHTPDERYAPEAEPEPCAEWVTGMVEGVKDPDGTWLCVLPKGHKSLHAPIRVPRLVRAEQGEEKP